MFSAASPHQHTTAPSRNLIASFGSDLYVYDPLNSTLYALNLRHFSKGASDDFRLTMLKDLHVDFKVAWL